MYRTPLVIGVLSVLVSLATDACRGADTAKSPPKPKRVISMDMHPMWLIIKEDTVCAERTPPWGAPSVEEYSKRVDRNLKPVESNPKVGLNYDFSAGELEDMKALYPDLAKRIKAAVERGQLGIVNGTYSQPHLQTLSLESSVRQFQFGTKSILDNFGYRVRTYAMQEPGYTDQTPQILKAFGYQYFHRGFFINRQAPMPGQTVAGNEPFCRWTGLDGTTILALQPAASAEVRAPDMDEFNVPADCEYVVLDKFEDQKAAAWQGPKPKVRTFIPWSYIEGSNADELSRTNTAAETALLQMETLSALAPTPKDGKPSPDMTPLWKTWLLAQHHDAYWTGGPELRAKSCGWLRDIIAKASQANTAVLDRIFPPAAEGKKSVVLFAVYPKRQRGVAVVPWIGNGPAKVERSDGKSQAVQVMPTGPNKGKLLAPFEFGGAGYERQIAGDSSQTASEPETIGAGWEFKNQYYAAQFRPEGSIESVRTAQGTTVVDKSGAAAALSAHIDGKPQRFEATAKTAVRWRGPVADIVESTGKFGAIPVVRRMILYRDLPWFEMEIECHFKDSSIGDFYDDTTKLALQWPVQPGTAMVQGIGGGAIPVDEPATAFYPVNWLDLSRGAGGMSMINFGTLKHVVKNGRLFVVLAWGANTKHFNNRCMDSDWAKAFDLRLQGKQTFRFALYPHDKDWRAAGVPDVAMSLLLPPVAEARTCPADAKPASKTLLTIDGNLIPTSVFAEGDRLVCRVYEPYGRTPQYSLKYLDNSIVPRLCNVADKPVDSLHALGIANLVLDAAANSPK
jgi:hypothetical protein